MNSVLRKLVMGVGAAVPLAFIVCCLTFACAGAQILRDGRPADDGCEQPEAPPHSPAAHSDNGPVVMARYFGPTRDYAHGVLGDAIEAEGLMVRFDDGEHIFCDVAYAGPDRVFEDTAPRLADVTGNGVNEVIAVASSQTGGARLELYGYPQPGKGSPKRGEDFQLLGHTPYIGRPNRWLAPVGAADFDGDGRVEIAYVETPHLGKVLRIVALEGDALIEIASVAGFTNHRIGEETISGGVRHCGDEPEIVLADRSWRSVMGIRFGGKAFAVRELGPFMSAEGMNSALEC